MFKWFKKKKKLGKEPEVKEPINLDSISSKAVPFDKVEMGKVYFVIKLTHNKIPLEFYQVFIDEICNFYSYVSIIGGVKLEPNCTSRKIYFLRLDKCPYSNANDLYLNNYVFKNRQTWSINEEDSKNYFFYDSFENLKEGSALLLKEVEQRRKQELQNTINEQMRLGKDEIKRELKGLEFELDSLQN